MGRVFAACIAVTTIAILAPCAPGRAGEKAEQDANLRAALELALVPPRINTRPGEAYADDNRDFNMIIGADRTPGGRIWTAWVSGGDSDEAYFVLATSDDEGETWSGPRVVIDPKNHSAGLRRRTLVGNLWTDPAGRLWLFFDQSIGFFDGRAGDWYTRCDNPDAARPAWTKPVRIWHGCTLQKPVVLSTGDWLLPVSLWQRYFNPRRGREIFAGLDDDRRAWVFASTDGGATWTKRGGVRFPHFNFDEHMIVELKDGRLWMTARTRKGIYETFSGDGGRTWAPPAPSAIVNTPARHFIRRLASGRILLVKNGPIDRNVGRHRLTAFLSADEGKTWTGGLALEGRERRCTYPDGFQAPGGRIFIVYDHERGDPRNGPPEKQAREILMARFTERDVLAEKIVSDGSRLRIPVNRATGK